MGAPRTSSKADTETDQWGQCKKAGDRQTNGQCQPNERGPVEYTSFKHYKCGVMGHITKCCIVPGQQVNGVPVTWQND